MATKSVWPTLPEPELPQPHILTIENLVNKDDGYHSCLPSTDVLSSRDVLPESPMTSPTVGANECSKTSACQREPEQRVIVHAGTKIIVETRLGFADEKVNGEKTAIETRVEELHQRLDLLGRYMTDVSTKLLHLEKAHNDLRDWTVAAINGAMAPMAQRSTRRSRTSLKRVRSKSLIIVQ